LVHYPTEYPVSINPVEIVQKLNCNPGLGCSKQRWHYLLGIKSILALNQLDLIEGFNAKIN
jgi:hypothetical protein